MLKIDIAIFSALAEEQEYLNEHFSAYHSQTLEIESFIFKIYHYNNKKILLIRSGIGSTFTACALTFIKYHFSPDFIFFSGTAGAIKAELKLQDVIIAENAFEAEFLDINLKVKNTPFASCLKAPFNDLIFPNKYSASSKLLQIAQQVAFSTANVYVGTVVSSDDFPMPNKLFEKIKSANPYSIDMETSAFYQVAWLFGVPALAIRGISNLLSTKDMSLDLKGSVIEASKVLLKIIDYMYPLLLLREKKVSKKYNSILNVAAECLRQKIWVISRKLVATKY